MGKPGSIDIPRARPWWLALVAVALCGPWPGWDPAPAALAAVVVLLAVLARPGGRDLLPWSAAALALILAVLHIPGTTSPDELTKELDRHTRLVLAQAEETVADPDLQRVLSAPGEALQPELPFEVLARHLGRGRERTLYLADDRGRVVAWAGAARPFPAGTRAIGPREWALDWSAGSATLVLREPMLLEGRLAGAVTLAEWSPLESVETWGMRAPRGSALRLGQGGSTVWQLRPAGTAGLPVPVAVVSGSTAVGPAVWWLPWVLLAVLALVVRPQVAIAAAALGGVALAAVQDGRIGAGFVIVVLVAGAGIFRWACRLPARRARVVVLAGLAAAVAAGVAGAAPVLGAWLPPHFLSPGWGGVWMAAVAWIVLGWPGRSLDVSSGLARRLAVASLVAGIGLAVEIARLPLELLRCQRSAPPAVVLPRGEVRLDDLLPAPVQQCRIDDLAATVAADWGLDAWRGPALLTVMDEVGSALSQWGSLGVAAPAARTVRRWPLELPQGGGLELQTAGEPWGWLRDWSPGASLRSPPGGSVKWAVLTRSGTVAATLHTEIRGLSAAAAGDLFHRGAGWARLRVGDGWRPARVWRRDDWLVCAVASVPAPAAWVVQVALAVLWALLGTLVVVPPRLRRGQVATFGGRLRLLVAGGVVLPLVVLTLFLHLRLRQEEVRLEQVIGLDAYRAARWTADHLDAVDRIDDEVARWLSEGIGAETLLFDGATPIAASRPDLLATGRLPGLPVEEVFPRFLLGRDAAVVVRSGRQLVAAGPVTVAGQRLLLQVVPPDPLATADSPSAVDWLLAGAALAAVLALVLTSRVEHRLSASLDELVTAARRLHAGEPVGVLRRPIESDLAAVVDAVRTMSLEVERRELSLRHQEELLRITLGTLDPAVVVLGADGEVRFANPSADELFSQHRTAVFEAVARMAGSDRPDEGPVVETVQPYAGRELTWRVGVAAVPLPDGGRGLVAAIDDVTDVVRADRLRQLTQLARIVAHEVKNPLTPIRLWVQELEEAHRRGGADLEPLIGEACREISHQVDRLQAMASSFSNLVALEHWEAVRTDLAELVPDALAGLAVLARRGVRLVTELPPHGTAVVVGDRQWLQRALGNLVRNSVDALAGEPGEIAVRIRVEGELIVLEVEDTGGGVPESQLGELFGPHFSTTSAGSGLGLALVHQVVARCQGMVRADNGSRGLVVRAELPRAPRAAVEQDPSARIGA